MYPRNWYRGAISPLTDARETIKNTDGLASRPFTFSVPKSVTVPFLKDSTVILPEFFFFFFDFAKVGLAINIKAHAKPIIIFFIFCLQSMSPVYTIYLCLSSFCCSATIVVWSVVAVLAILFRASAAFLFLLLSLQTACLNTYK